MNEGKCYEHVGIECGTLENGTEVVGILYPVGEPIPGIDPDLEAKYMTLPCAKALLIDLRDAIQAAEEHQKRE
jgi:hypothetical protein